MSEIIFHGKRLDNGEWVEGYYCRAFRWTGDKEPQPTIQENDCFMFRLIDPSTVGQYTGLHDGTKWEQLTKEEQSEWLKSHTKEEWNGKRIFEGDIVCIPVECMPTSFLLNHYEVRWCKTNPGPGFALYRDDTFYDWAMGEIEVIGNIHDDPELLERGRE